MFSGAAVAACGAAVGTKNGDMKYSAVRKAPVAEAGWQVEPDRRITRRRQKEKNGRNTVKAFHGSACRQGRGLAHGHAEGCHLFLAVRDVYSTWRHSQMKQCPSARLQNGYSSGYSRHERTACPCGSHHCKTSCVQPWRSALDMSLAPNLGFIAKKPTNKCWFA